MKDYRIEVSTVVSKLDRVLKDYAEHQEILSARSRERSEECWEYYDRGKANAVGDCIRKLKDVRNDFARLIERKEV